MPAPVKRNTWHLWFILLLGMWLAAGHPMPGWLPIPGGSAPFAVADGKLHIMIVRESQARLNNDQFAVVNGPTLRKLPAGHWRVYDPQQDASRDDQWARDAFAVTRSSIPWQVLSNGKSGESGPLSANEAELETLLKKYGGL